MSEIHAHVVLVGGTLRAALVAVGSKGADGAGGGGAVDWSDLVSIAATGGSFSPSAGRHYRITSDNVDETVAVAIGSLSVGDSFGLSVDDTLGNGHSVLLFNQGGAFTINGATTVAIPTDCYAVATLQAANALIITVRPKTDTGGTRIQAAIEGVYAIAPGSAASINHYRCPSLLKITLAQNCALTITGAVPNKPTTLAVSHSGGPWTLSWAGTDLVLEGAANQTEYLTVIHNGTNWHVFRAGVVDVTI